MEPVETISDIENAVAGLAREPDSALVVVPDVFTVAFRSSIESAGRYRSPALTPATSRLRCDPPVNQLSQESG
jgi:hypothetical protein